MQAEPIVVASAAASQYGANYPDLMWVDMERILHERGLIHFRSVAASIGGYEDAGLGMSDQGRQLVCDAIDRNGLTLLRADSFQEAIHRRMEIYRLRAGDRPIKAYINVGGGTISTGRALGKKMYQPGLNREPPPEASRIDSVMNRFANTGTPVIHMVQIPQIAAAYGLPSAPQAMPEVGGGLAHSQPRYNRWLAAGVLLVLLLTLRSVIQTGVRRQLQCLLMFVGWPRKSASTQHADYGGELMV
jgi:poly-gamma-glutamate system protein